MSGSSFLGNWIVSSLSWDCGDLLKSFYTLFLFCTQCSNQHLRLTQNTPQLFTNRGQEARDTKLKQTEA